MATILSQARSAVEDAFPKKPTPEQLKVSAPMREAQRKKMIDILDYLSKEEVKNQYTDVGGSDLYKKTIAWLKDEIAWWNANIELTPEAVEKRTQMEKEYLTTVEKTFSELLVASRDKNAQVAQDKKKQQEATLNRSWTDDVSDAVQIALAWSLALFWILLGIRLGGLMANDLLYKPVAYRALAFGYSFLFLPILLPYWLYREVKHWFWPDIEAPHFESIFPVVPYDPAEPLTLEKRLYGYPDTPELKAWLAKKQQEEEQSWLSVLGTTILQTLMAEREEENKKA
jgi:hypothetical protein